MPETQRSGSAVQSPQAVTDYIQQASRNRTEFLNLFQQVCGSAQQAGITEQEILNNIHQWYTQGSSGQSGSGSSR